MNLLKRFAAVLGVVGTRFPGIEVSEDALDDAGAIDQGNDVISLEA